MGEESKELKNPGLVLAIIFPGLMLAILIGVNVFTPGYFQHVTYQGENQSATVVKETRIDPPNCAGGGRSPESRFDIVTAQEEKRYVCVQPGKYEVGQTYSFWINGSKRAFDFGPYEFSIFFTLIIGTFVIFWHGGNRLYRNSQRKT